MATDPDLIFSQQKTYADTAVSDAQPFINRLYELASAPDLDIGDLPAAEYTSRFGAVSAPRTLVPPTIILPTTQMPELESSTVTLPSEVTVPELAFSPPAVSLPTAPSTDLPAAPAIPTVGDVSVPTAPVLSLPAVPTIGTIALPSSPALNLPAFDLTLPSDDLVTPTANFTFAEQEYSSALLTAWKAKLLNDLQNGGYGIEPADEAPLWERARDRERENYDDVQGDLVHKSAARGFDWAPGDLNVALQRASFAYARNVSDANRQIMLERAKMFVENRRFTIEQVREMETVLLQYHGAVQERALNAQKAILDFAIQVYNASVEKARIKIQAYQAYAQAFESRVRAATAVLDAYRTEMEGKRIESEIQRQKVELYQAQLASVKTVIEIYRVQMDAAQVQATIERTKLDATRAAVEAYTSQVQAKVAAFNMFEAQIKGEMAKVQIYESQVKAYGTEVEAAKTRADTRLSLLRGQIDTGRLKVDEYAAKIRGYEAQIGADLKTVDLSLQKYSADTQAFVAASNLDLGVIRANSELANLDANLNLRNLEISQRNAEIQLQALKVVNDIRMTATQGALNTFSNLAGHAMSTMNAVVSSIKQ